MKRRQAVRGLGLLALVWLGLVAAALASGSALSQTPGLSILMSDSPDPVTVGDKLTYDVTVSAAHFDTVDVTETIPPGVDYVEAESSCLRQEGTQYAVCQGQIGGEVVYKFVVIPGSPGMLTNEANAYGHGSGDQVSATETTQVLRGDEPTLAIAGTSVVEGDASTRNADFNVSLSHATAGTVQVDYTTSDSTAVAGSDYTQTTGTLTFDPGQRTKSVSVPIKGDLVGEQTEAFLVELSNARGASIGTGSGLGTIIDDDHDLGLAITGREVAAVGDIVSYSVAAVNNGAAPATDVVLTVSLSSNIQFTGGSFGSECQPVGTGWRCSLGSLPGGVTRGIAFDALARSSGTATVSAAVTTSAGDPDPADNSGSLATSILKSSADLFSQISGPSRFPGSLGFDLAIGNTGPNSALDYSVTVHVPPQVQLVQLCERRADNSSVCHPISNDERRSGIITVRPHNHRLLPGASTLLTLAVREMTRGLGTTTVSVSGTPDLVDPNPGNNSASLTMTFTGETVSAEVASGQSLSTDGEGDGATPDDPIETRVTTPNAGTVTIGESEGSPSASGPFFVLGEIVRITAPAASASNPLTIQFWIDPSRLPSGVTAENLQLFRNGVQIPACASGSSGASPDPCVSIRVTAQGGDVVIVVRTSQASDWTFGSAIVDRGLTAGALQPVTGAKTVFGVASNGRSVKGLLQYGSFTANVFLAIAIDANKAWFAGVGRDGRTLLAYVEDNGPKGSGDVFKLWIGGVLQTGDGRLAKGDVVVKR